MADEFSVRFLKKYFKNKYLIPSQLAFLILYFAAFFNPIKLKLNKLDSHISLNLA